MRETKYNILQNYIEKFKEMYYEIKNWKIIIL